MEPREEHRRRQMGRPDQLMKMTMPVDSLEKLRTGDVHGALDALKQEVRKAPRNPRLRTFLFQMFCVTGEWDRALTQLSAAAELDPAAVPMAQAYRSAIRCEVLREKVFRGERSPTVLGDPGPWLPLLIEAAKLLAAGKPDDAARLRDAAFEAAAETPGTMNEDDFGWIADADPRLGPVLEVFVNGNYLWVPYARLKALRLDPPADLRDQVWMPANFTWSNDGETVGFIPARYPGSAAAADPALALSHRTDWYDAGGGWSLPLGARVLVTDASETALLDIRALSITPSNAEVA
jgi:type VI secretion system protein ImpE